MLGATIRLEAYTDAHNNILAVTNVFHGGPSSNAGIESDQDFIIGTREMSFTSLDEFAKYVQVNEGQEIRLFLYSKMTEKVREVALTPNRKWGNKGLLGCDVSFGYLNKIPLRAIDRERASERKAMQSIFGKLSGDNPTEE